MQSLRTANALLRLALALVFGIMSLAHGPVMAFARAGTSPAAHELATAPAAGHHHHAATQPMDDDPEGLVPQLPEGIATCYPAGCFIVVVPMPAGPAALSNSLLGQLRAAPARVLAPVVLDPLLPPPRFRA